MLRGSEARRAKYSIYPDQLWSGINYRSSSSFATQDKFYQFDKPPTIEQTLLLLSILLIFSSSF